jgi:hypothetical protein
VELPPPFLCAIAESPSQNSQQLSAVGYQLKISKLIISKIRCSGPRIEKLQAEG